MSKFVVSCVLSLLAAAVVQGQQDDLNFVQSTVRGGNAQYPSLEECRLQAEKVGEAYFKKSGDFDGTRQEVVNAVKKCMGQDASEESVEGAAIVAEHADKAAMERTEEAKRSTDMSKTNIDEAKAAAAKSAATDAETNAAKANAVAAAEKSKAADAILRSEVAALGVAGARVASGELKVADYTAVLQEREKSLDSAVERVKKAEIEEAEKKEALEKQKELEASAEVAKEDAQRKADAANEQVAKDQADLNTAEVDAKLASIDLNKIQDDPVEAVSEDLKLKRQGQYDAQLKVATAENVSAGGARTMFEAMKELTAAAQQVHEAMGVYLTASQKGVVAAQQRKVAAQTKLKGAEEELDGFKEALAKQRELVASANQTSVEAADDASAAADNVQVVARAAEAAGMTAEKTQADAEKSVVKAQGEVASAAKAVKEAPSDLGDAAKTLQESRKTAQAVNAEMTTSSKS